jgi:uncharacterized RDD family membrane protein YckC
MYCSRCGKPLPEGAAFCPACGAPVVAGSVGMPSEPPGTPQGASSTQGPVAPAPAVVLYGGFWRRVVAFIIDGLVVGAVMTPFGLGLGFAHLAAALSGDMTPEALAAIITTSLFVWFIRVIVSWLYGAGFESSPLQATPGKLLLGLRVTDLEGRRITFLRATGRAVGKWISGVLLGMGYVLAAFTDRKQGLHDLIAGTLVRR